ncbi:hypothetical protein Tco_1054751 [Tanacetum coccineum]|uniref:Uncharacterized protein n=1 Tax=Tanacetum coccineum TaxID=301880 RepID=A0ABQ5GY31_9ASTR
MPTEMELTLEQTQQGVSYEVSVFTMKMEILLEPTSNKLMVEHAEYDESNTYVLERFNTTAGNPVKKILLKLNLSDHRLFKDGGGGIVVMKKGDIKAMVIAEDISDQHASSDDNASKASSTPPEIDEQPSESDVETSIALDQQEDEARRRKMELEAEEMKLQEILE